VAGAPPASAPFDIVFLDPPYDARCWRSGRGAAWRRLAPDARVYVEQRAREGSAGVARDVEAHSRRAGWVRSVIIYFPFEIWAT
jgi:16S rRNA G966 N2-methylase RsmD